MRILIVGTVPPPGGDAAATLAEIATKFLAEGHDVELLSPDDRSAAHRSARLEGPLFALRLAWLSRRFEAVVLHFEEGLPLGPRAGRLWRAVTLTALAAALRMFRETTVRFDAASPIPGGIGSRAMGEIWSSVSHVVVGNEKNRDQLVSLWSLPEERVTVEPGRPVARTTLPRGWSVGDDEDPRTAVLDLVRARAAHDRAAMAARIALGGAIGPAPEAPFAGDAKRTIDPESVARAVIALARHLAQRIAATDDASAGR
ncbi:MAG: hypothetical protein WAL35_07965 [Acidimicrobiales bacterium]